MYASFINAQTAKRLCTAKSDIVFIVDASGSIGVDNFELQRQFMLDFVSNLDIGADNVRIAMIRFSTYTNIIFNWLDDRIQIERFIKDMAYVGSSTNTGDALKQANDELIPYSRESNAKLVLLITDGQSYGGSNPIVEASKLKEKGVRLISVGVGNSLNENELRAISSGNTFYHIQDFNSLNSHVESLTESTCITILAPKASALPPEFQNVKRNFICPMEVCSAKKGDVAFLLDMSATIGEEIFNTQLEFILNMVNKLDVGYEKLKATLILFGNSVTISFKRLDDKKEIENQIQSITYSPGTGATKMALQTALDQVFAEPQLGESNLLFLLTDGMSIASQGDIYKEADNLKNRGVKIVTIGVGKTINMQILESFSSEKMSYKVENPSDSQELFKKEIKPASPTATPMLIYSKPNISHYSHAYECPNEICGVPHAYLAILLDANPEFEFMNYTLQLKFINNLTKKMNIQKDKVCVSIIAFSDTVTKIFDWHDDPKEIEIKTKSIKFTSGVGRATGEALQRARQELSKEIKKVGVKKLILLITNGAHTTPVDPKNEAETLKNNQVKIATIAIGQNVNESTLVQLSSPKLFFPVPTFDDLSTVFIKEPFSTADPCPTEICSIDQIDLVILLDNSRWIGSANFNSTKRFVQRIVNSLNISSVAVRVSLVTVSEHAVVHLKWAADKPTIMEKISNINNSMNSPTEFGNALNKINKEVFNTARSNVQKTILLITNGRPRGTPNHKKFADELKSLNVSIVVVGITQNADREDLSVISSPQNHYFLKEYEDLGQLFIKEEFVKEEPCPPAVCSSVTTDYVFILDKSLGRDKYLVQIQFMRRIIKKMNLSDIRIAVVTVGGSNTGWLSGNDIQIYLDSLEENLNRNSMLQFVSYTDSKSDGLGDGLKQAREELFSKGREGVSKVLMLLSDGTNVGSVNPIKEAGFLKDANISIVSVGIGEDADRSLLNAISSPNLSYCVKSTDDLVNVFDDTKKDSSASSSPPTNQFCKRIACPQEICSRNKTDLIFVLGIGGKVTKSSFQMQLDFLRGIVNNLKCGSNEHRLSFVTFDSNATVVFDWLDDKNEIVNQIQNVSYSANNLKDDAEGAMAQALRVSNEQLFNTSRFDAAKVLLLLDNGITSSSLDQVDEADNLKNENVTIVTVAVGERVDRYLLNAISSPDMVCITETYEDLANLYNPIERAESESSIILSRLFLIVICIVGCFGTLRMF